MHIFFSEVVKTNKKKETLEKLKEKTLLLLIPEKQVIESSFCVKL